MSYKEGYEAIINKYDALKAEIENKEITETYTEEMKEQELKDNEEARNNELKQYDIDYKNAMDSIQNIAEKLADGTLLTINNTKYIYLTFDNKYLAIKQLEEEEYVKYSQEFDAIGPKYDTLAANINNKYDKINGYFEKE